MSASASDRVILANEFNRPGHANVGHRTFDFLGDGGLMEGTSPEVCALSCAPQAIDRSDRRLLTFVLGGAAVSRRFPLRRTATFARLSLSNVGHIRRDS